MNNKFIAYLLLAFLVGTGIGFPIGYHFGFIKHHPQIYIKYENINRSLFTDMKKAGIPYTIEQAQDLTNLIKREKR
jgi:hypothetical protein